MNSPGATENSMKGSAFTAGGSIVYDPKATPSDWSEALSESTEQAREHALAWKQSGAPQKRRSQGALVAAAAVLLAAVTAWDVHVMTRPQNMPLPADEAVDLRWFLADAVELIENFRAEEGRLPSRADLGDLLGDSFSLEIRGQMYVIGLEGAGTSVRYDGSVPLDEWVLGAEPVGAQGDAP